MQAARALACRCRHRGAGSSRQGRSRVVAIAPSEHDPPRRSDADARSGPHRGRGNRQLLALGGRYARMSQQFVSSTDLPSPARRRNSSARRRKFPVWC
jgi:hypothetical protein